MHDVQRTGRFPFFDHAADADLAGPLADHLDVDAVLAQGAEEAPRDSLHTWQLAPDSRDYGLIGHEVHVAPGLEAVDGTLQRLGPDPQLVFAPGGGEQAVLRMDGHGYVNFGRRDEID